MKIFFATACLMLAFNLHGQNKLRGQLISTITGKPLTYTYIYNKKGRNYAQTDSNGIFYFTISKRKMRLTTGHYCGNKTDTIIKAGKTNPDITIYSPCWYYPSAWALKDISNNALQFICGMGEAPLNMTANDTAFEKEFGLKYEITGCMYPPFEIAISYNRTIAEYLDKKFGTIWRKKVRPDVYGVTR
jgi:hypothetical protein